MPPGLEQPLQHRQRLAPGATGARARSRRTRDRRIPRLQGQGEEIRLPELHVGEARAASPAPSPPRECSAETSIEVKRAPGLLRASVTVCAPVPQPASRTVLPCGIARYPSGSRSTTLTAPGPAAGRVRVLVIAVHVRASHRSCQGGRDPWRHTVATSSLSPALDWLAGLAPHLPDKRGSSLCVFTDGYSNVCRGKSLRPVDAVQLLAEQTQEDDSLFRKTTAAVIGPGSSRRSTKPIRSSAPSLATQP